MTPLHALGYGAAALAAYWLYKNKVKPALGSPEGQGGNKLTPGMVSTLEKGKTYTVLAVVTKDITNDSRWQAPGQPSGMSFDKVAAIIASTFAQSGCKVLNKPTIRDNYEGSKMVAGEPSTWVFNMQWLMDGDHITAVIPWLAGATFYLVPTA